LLQRDYQKLINSAPKPDNRNNEALINYLNYYKKLENFDEIILSESFSKDPEKNHGIKVISEFIKVNRKETAHFILDEEVIPSNDECMEYDLSNAYTNKPEYFFNPKQSKQS